ncbi:ATP-binding protein [Nakamurella lactea]|uniref:ATP-binding protein n=1 Tax=Nakamurella lactea TaxID=459515 RepID=UPI00041A2141|nr:ATP-binding protein [Nakamurella lactea]
MSLESPYKPGPGLAPPQIAGRQAEFSEAFTLLRRIENYGAVGRAPLVYTGIRGMGKTVLLRQVAIEAQNRGFVVASVRANSETSVPQLVATTIGKALADLPGNRVAGSWQQWKDRLARLDVQVNLAGLVTVTKKADPGPDGHIEPHVLHELIASSAQIVREQNRPGLLITIDEIQSASRSGRITIGHVLQSLGEDPNAPVPATIISAGLPNSSDSLTVAGTFTERFTYRRLPGLSESEAAEALLAPANRLGVGFNDDAVGLILAEADGSPYLIQLLGDQTWVAAAPDRPQMLTVEHARRGLAVASEELTHGMFRTRWQRATPMEKQVLTAVVRRLNPAGIAQISDVASDLERTTKDISQQRSSLIDKGILQPAGWGEIGFSTPAFARYVRAQTSSPLTDGPSRKELLAQIVALRQQLDATSEAEVPSPVQDTAQIHDSSPVPDDGTEPE